MSIEWLGWLAAAVLAGVALGFSVARGRLRARGRRAQVELARARELRAIVDSAPDAIILADDEGRIELVNIQAEVLFGYRRDELLGQTIELLVPCAHREAHVGHREQFLSSEVRARGMGIGLELLGRHADGTTFPIDVNLSTSELGGRAMTSAAVRDISVHRAIEAELTQARAEAEHSNRAKTRFLAAASHDLRQPLQSLSMYQAVLMRSPPEKQADVARKMGISIVAMSTLLDALLNVSKLDAGAVEPSIQDFALADVIERVVAEVAPLAAEKGLALEVQRSTHVVRSDPALLESILANLAGNAVRYTDQGRVSFRWRETQSHLVVEVADTGMGIPQSAFDTIFEEFTQLHNDARGRHHGLGLGLSLVRRLAALLEHPVGVTSSVGGGSVFTVTLPIVGAAEILAEEEARASCNVAGNRRVLFVEDDLDVLDATALLLSTAGFEVSAHAGAEEALAEVSAGFVPDLIISDFRLPGDFTGLQLIDKLRDSTGVAIPAIIVTGDTSDEPHTEHPIETVYKPVDGEALLARAQALLV